jgi:hypothetical protein
LEEKLETSSSSILLNLYSKYLTNEALDRFGDLKIGQVIHIVKYADNVVLPAKEEVVLQGMIDMIDRLTEVGQCCGMGMNV